jgi:aryl carrier-like protein
VLASEEYVDALRGQRQTVLDENFDLVQAGLDKILREDRETAFP